MQRGLGATAYQGAVRSVDLQLGKEAIIDRSILRMPINELMEQHADTSEPRWNQRITMASRILEEHGIRTPANILAIGKLGVQNIHGNTGTKVRAHKLMEDLGLDEIWEPHPTIQALVPYCSLSDIPEVCLGSKCVPRRKRVHSVQNIIDMTEAQVAAYLGSLRNPKLLAGRMLRKDAERYAAAFTKEKHSYDRQRNALR
jgi:hypothetical protein